MGRFHWEKTRKGKKQQQQLQPSPRETSYANPHMQRANNNRKEAFFKGFIILEKYKG
jgi:hypothetical protein